MWSRFLSAIFEIISFMLFKVKMLQVGRFPNKDDHTYTESGISRVSCVRAKSSKNKNNLILIIYTDYDLSVILLDFGGFFFIKRASRVD